MHRLLSLLAIVSLLAAEDRPVAPEQAAVNTVCPVTGKRIDPERRPVQATTGDGRAIRIGVCSDACAGIIAKDPARYAALAEANKAERRK